MVLLENVCRLCADTAQCLPIFGEEADRNSLRHKLKICSPITVKETDKLPKQLCLDCLSNLDNTYEFYQKVKQAQFKLSAMMNSNTALKRNLPVSDHDPKRFCFDSSSITFQSGSNSEDLVKLSTSPQSNVNSPPLFVMVNGAKREENRNDNTASNEASPVKTLENKLPSELAPNKPSFSVCFGTKEELSTQNNKMTTPAALPAPKDTTTTPAALPAPKDKISTPAALAAPKERMSTPAALPAPKDTTTAPAALPAPKDKISTPAALAAPKERMSTPAALPAPKERMSTPAALPAPKERMNTPAALPAPKDKISTPAALPVPKGRMNTPAALPAPKDKISTPAALAALKERMSTPAALPAPKERMITPAALAAPKDRMSTPAALPAPKDKTTALAASPSKAGLEKTPTSTTTRKEDTKKELIRKTSPRKKIEAETTPLSQTLPFLFSKLKSSPSKSPAKDPHDEGKSFRSSKEPSNASPLKEVVKEALTPSTSGEPSAKTTPTDDPSSTHFERLSDQEANKPQKELHKCKYCNKSFSEEHILCHEQLHKGKSIYSCTECETGFIIEEAFIRHVQRHKKKSINNPPETNST